MVVGSIPTYGAFTPKLFSSKNTNKKKINVIMIIGLKLLILFTNDPKNKE